MLQIEAESEGALLANPKRTDPHDELIPGVSREHGHVLQRLSVAVPEFQVADSTARLKIRSPSSARFQAGHELEPDLILIEVRHAQVGLRVPGDDRNGLLFDLGDELKDFRRRGETEVQAVAFGVLQIRWIPRRLRLRRSFPQVVFAPLVTTPRFEPLAVVSGV